MSKRKAPDAQVSDSTVAHMAVGDRPPPLPSLDLSNTKTTSKTVVAALLSLLPNGATGQDAAAKKLLRAIPLLMAELDARTKAMARANESEGTRLPIAFRFASGDTTGNNDDDDDDREGGGGMTVIHMPEECFVKMMTYLNGREVVNASVVGKAWLSVSRMPSLWERLDDSNGLSNKGRKMNVTSLLALLGRPQFTNLKTLILPFKVKLGKSSIKAIANSCPHLETWDVGYSRGAGRGKDGDLIEAAETFVNLTSIRTSMWDVTSYGIAHASKAMGAQLLDLRVSNDCICSHYLSDAALVFVAEFCPNLKHFAYIIKYRCWYKEEHDMLTGAGVTHLIRGCRRLEVLELQNAERIQREDFIAILNMLAQDDTAAKDVESMFALRKINLIEYPFFIEGNPFAVVDHIADIDYNARNGMDEALVNDE
jgi:hypothetical protein